MFKSFLGGVCIDGTFYYTAICYADRVNSFDDAAILRVNGISKLSAIDRLVHRVINTTPTSDSVLLYCTEEDIDNVQSVLDLSNTTRVHAIPANDLGERYVFNCRYCKELASFTFV